MTIPLPFTLPLHTMTVYIYPIYGPAPLPRDLRLQCPTHLTFGPAHYGPVDLRLICCCSLRCSCCCGYVGRWTLLHYALRLRWLHCSCCCCYCAFTLRLQLLPVDLVYPLFVGTVAPLIYGRLPLLIAQTVVTAPVERYVVT